MNPQMLQKEITVIENILLSYGLHLDILEWGSDGNTFIWYICTIIEQFGITSYTS